RVEGGDLDTAYDQAADFVRGRPNSAEGHFTLGYVLRYTGLLEESGRECEAARRLDPRNRGWRSCGMTFMQLGQYESARNFFALDAGSQLVESMSTTLLLREGKRKEAADRIRTHGHISQTLAACLTGRPAAEVESLARQEAA